MFDFDDNEDPEELERLEQERIQRSMKNLYSQARTVRRCLQYATKVLERYDVSGVFERERQRERERDMLAVMMFIYLGDLRDSQLHETQN